jgi:hypothetical protein
LSSRPLAFAAASAHALTTAARRIFTPQPSGGDWALERMGALLFEGTVDASVADCRFERIDSNAVFLSGFNRRAQVLRNEFSLLGNNAVASWGRSVDYDGTGGQQPRHSVISGNIVHDIGLVQKQSSFYFQAQSCENLLSANIAYNLPRAAVNFEDGFGGANVLTDNLLYNTCRESSDHGAFNVSCGCGLSDVPSSHRRLLRTAPYRRARPPRRTAVVGQDALRDHGRRWRDAQRHPGVQ